MPVTWNDDRFLEKRCGLFILRVTPPFRQHVANSLPSHSLAQGNSQLKCSNDSIGNANPV